MGGEIKVEISGVHIKNKRSGVLNRAIDILNQDCEDRDIDLANCKIIVQVLPKEENV